jgi:lipoyl-dependent peroxiredoxin
MARQVKVRDREARIDHNLEETFPASDPPLWESLRAEELGKGNEMAVRTAEATWNGTLKEGQGQMRLGSGAFEGGYSFTSRMGDGKGTNPEELVAAAHAGCFSMALAAALGQAGATPRRVHTTARVHFEQADGGWGIPRIDLETEVEAEGLDEGKFQSIAEGAKTNCPISKLVKGAQISLSAKLVVPA